MKKICKGCNNHYATYVIVSNELYICDKCKIGICCNTWVVSISYYLELKQLYNKFYPKASNSLKFFYKILKKLSR